MALIPRKTYPELTALSGAVVGTDVLAAYRSPGPLSRTTAAAVATYVTSTLGPLATLVPGTGVATALAINVGSAGAFVTFNGALGTPSSATLTNATGLPIAGLVPSTSTAIGVGSIELGNASDTTLTRSSAGNVAIEGNLIYRAGGTDVPVADGGTGASTEAGARTNIGVPVYGTMALAEAATIIAEVKAIDIQGRTTAGTGAFTAVRMSLATITSSSYPALAYFRSTDRFMPDGSTDNTNGGYWLMVPGPNGYDVTAFGAVQDDTTDSAAAINAAATAVRSFGEAKAALYAPPGLALYCATALDLRLVRFINILCDIRVNSGIVAVPVVCGGYSNGFLCHWTFQAVTDGSSTLGAPPSRPIMRWMGVKASTIAAGSCNYLQIYADTGAGAGYDSTAWNSITLSDVQSKLEITDAGGYSWCTENYIIADRIFIFSIIGVGYVHNHNRLYGGTFEGSTVALTFANCSSNYVYNARFEAVSSAPGVTFSSTADSNVVIGSWNGAGNSQDMFRVIVPVSDSGESNTVTTEFAHLYRKTELFSVSAASGLIGTATSSSADNPRIAPGSDFGGLLGSAVIVPGLVEIGWPAGFYWIALSDPIPVRLGDCVTFEADYDGSLFRPTIYVLDSNMVPLTSEGAGGAYVALNSGTFDATYGRYATVADVADTALPPVPVIRSEVAYIRVGLFGNTAGSIRSLSAAIWTQMIGRDHTESAARPKSAIRTLSGTPTRGFVPINTLMYDRGSSALRRCSFSFETTVNGALSTGATSVTVTAVTGVANGDIVGILMDNDVTHWTSVSALAGSTFTIAAIPASRSVANGAAIVFNRWT